MRLMRLPLLALTVACVTPACSDDWAGPAAPGAGFSGTGGTGGGGSGAAGAGPAGGAGTAGGAGAAGSAGSSGYTHDEVSAAVFPKDRVLDIQFDLAPGVWEAMIKNAELEQYSSGEVTVDGQDLGTIGLRFKGAYSLDSCVDDQGNLTCEKLSLKLKFNEVNPDTRLFGLKKLILNKILGGGDVVAETLGYELFNDMGVVAPRTSYATVTVNGESQGLYTVVEALDGRFTKDRFDPGDGNLYKEAWPNQTSSSYFQQALETNEETADNSTFIGFASAMLASDDSNRVATLGQYMDLNKLADYMAVDYGIANWDGITTYYCGSWGCSNHNFYMYQDEDRAHFTLIPWDLNACLNLSHWLGNIQPWDTLDADCSTLVPTGDGDLSTKNASCDPMIRAIALNKAAYHASVQRLLDQYFTLPRLGARIDALVAQVTPAIATDPFLSMNELTGGSSWVKGNLPGLRARLEAVVAPTP